MHPRYELIRFIPAILPGPPSGASRDLRDLRDLPNRDEWAYAILDHDRRRVALCVGQPIARRVWSMLHAGALSPHQVRWLPEHHYHQLAPWSDHHVKH